ncbi:MAG: hypothetical protein WBB98_01615 [Xanthobacteraceae bacterium]
MAFFAGPFALIEEPPVLDAAFLAPLTDVALRAPTADEPDFDFALAPAFEAALAVFLADAFAFTPALTPTLGLEAFLCVFLDIRLPFVAFDRSIGQHDTTGQRNHPNHVLVAGQTGLPRDMVTGIRLHRLALHAAWHAWILTGSTRIGIDAAASAFVTQPGANAPRRASPSSTSAPRGNGSETTAPGAEFPCR